MSAENEIDERLRQDEAELKAKRKRLKSFATAVDDMRTSQESAAVLAEELISSGDLTRNDLGKVFKLSRAEKTVLLPVRRGSTSEPKPDSPNTAADKPKQPESRNEDSKQKSSQGKQD